MHESVIAESERNVDLVRLVEILKDVDGLWKTGNSSWNECQMKERLPEL
jgi:hypothetical protein